MSDRGTTLPMKVCLLASGLAGPAMSQRAGKIDRMAIKMVRRRNAEFMMLSPQRPPEVDGQRKSPQKTRHQLVPLLERQAAPLGNHFIVRVLPRGGDSASSPGKGHGP